MGGDPAVFPQHMTQGRRVRALLREQQLAVVVGDAELPERADGKPEVVLPNGLFALRYQNGGGCAPSCTSWKGCLYRWTERYSKLFGRRRKR
jgi:hypothetical protein